MLPSKNPGQRPTITSDNLLDYPPQCATPHEEKTFECYNPTGEGKDSSFAYHSGGGKDSVVSNPTGGGKDSLFSHPSGGGKDSVFSHPTGGGKDSLCKALAGRGGKTPCVQSHGVFIQDQAQKQSKPPVGSRLKLFLPT